jgi:hypothetical protein
LKVQQELVHPSSSCLQQLPSFRISSRLLVVATGLLVLLSGCAQQGPDLVKAGRNDYNKVLAQTEEEEQLLNLVRLRYADNPMMLNVSSISTSFTWTQSTSAEAFKFESGSNDSNVGIRGNLGYSERPTVTYTPLGGKDFVENLLTPVELDSLLLLSRTGWSIDRLMRVMVNRVSGVPNAHEASGPTPAEAPEFEDFIRITQLLRILQQRDAVTGGYLRIDDKRAPAVRIETGAIDSSELDELYTLLGLKEGLKFLGLDSRGRLKRPDAIGFEMRPLIGIMFFLSHAVEIPQSDQAARRVTITRDADGQPFDWSRVTGDLLVIKSQAEPPANAAVAVSYRGNWFYIDDSDMNSKYTFMLLSKLTALQSGNIERAGPLLTLPVTSP